MPALFAITLFVSAGLMFAVQPMIAKSILPRFGGTPAVWNTCMVFFQAALLAGYGYVHVVSRRLSIRAQAYEHVCLLLVAALMAPMVLSPLLPLPDGALATDANPIPFLLKLLLVCVGVPFFALSATAPLLQKWFAGMRHESAGDPYFLYAASNLGSMLGLIAYPLVMEPTFTLPMQGWLWVAGYGLLLALTVVCAVMVWRHAPPETPIGGLERLPLSVGLGMRLRWLALAFVPSSLLYGATTYLTTDIAAVPLLWVLPLAVYLLTFILAFARRPLIRHDTLVHALPLAILWQTFVFSLQRPIWLLFLFHLLTLFVVALACHGELARLRPSPRHLTVFYLWLSAGGVLGGIFNTLLAPLLFDSLVEYPLGLVLVCFLVTSGERRPHAPREGLPHAEREAYGTGGGATSRAALDWHDLWIPIILFLALSVFIPEVRSSLRELAPEVRLPLQVTLIHGLPVAVVYFFHDRPIRFGMSVGALLLAGGMGGDAPASELVHRERGFFGIVRVVERFDRDLDIKFRRFVHGNTLHGMQVVSEDAETRRRPLSYYFANGPIGELFASFQQPAAKNKVAVLGLGAGALASYAEAGQEWTFYEIDPAVPRIADTYFTFLDDARNRGATVDVVVGDARLALADAPAGRFDVIVADAFSSDAVPVHLLTREALALYRSKLAPGGVLVFNVTNRYLDLEPVLAGLADDAGLVARLREEVDTPIGADDLAAGKQPISAEDKKQGKAPSRWVIMAQAEGDLGTLADKPRWRRLQSRPNARVWTDDYSNLLRVLRW